MDEPVDRWLTVWLADDSKLLVVESEEPRVSAAVEAWISSGMTRDVLLCMDGLAGRTVNYRASQIVGWMISTPGFRRADAMQEARDKDEIRTYRQEAGLPFDD